MAGSSRKAHDFLRSIAGFTEANAGPNIEGRPIRLGTVDYDYDPNDFLGGIYPRIMFDGEKVVSQKRYKTMVGYYPLPGQRVVLLPIGTTYLIIGTVSLAPHDPKVDIFATTGTDTWEKPQGARVIRVQVQAGGGAGGGAPATTSQTAAAGGGAGGAYGETWFPATEVAASVTVTVGVGGTGASGTTGGNGGTSSFGSLVSATGGPGGGTTAAGTTNTGVNGADTTSQTVVGDIVIRGGGGGAAMRLATQGAIGGVGGSSQMGNGGRGKAITTGSAAGDNGQGYGGGGSGGVNGSTNNANTGGDGAPGVVIVTTYF